jgi:hypothetical protein
MTGATSSRARAVLACLSLAVLAAGCSSGSTKAGTSTTTRAASPLARFCPDNGTAIVVQYRNASKVPAKPGGVVSQENLWSPTPRTVTSTDLPPLGGAVYPLKSGASEDQARTYAQGFSRSGLGTVYVCPSGTSG